MQEVNVDSLQIFCRILRRLAQEVEELKWSPERVELLEKFLFASKALFLISAIEAYLSHAWEVLESEEMGRQEFQEIRDMCLRHLMENGTLRRFLEVDLEDWRIRIAWMIELARSDNELHDHQVAILEASQGLTEALNSLERSVFLRAGYLSSLSFVFMSGEGEVPEWYE